MEIVGGIIGNICMAFLAYLIGSLNLSIWCSRTIQKKDLRNFYSKSAGATNASRVMGFRFAVITAMFDVLKLPFCLVIAWAFSFIVFVSDGHHDLPFKMMSYYVPAFFCILGHCFPIYYQFKGGKGVACFGGFTWMISPWVFLIAFVLWWGFVFTYRIVSVASLVAIFFASLVTWIPQIHAIFTFDLHYRTLLQSKTIWFNHVHKYNTNNCFDNLLTLNLTVTSSAVLIFYMHRKNIQRIIQGEEKLFFYSKKVKKSNKQ